MNNLQILKKHFTLNTPSRMLLRVFFTILCACCIFATLYYHDNTYTHNTMQPTSGLLSFSSKDLTEHDIYFLTRDWEYYPSLLLSPEDFKNKSPQTYKKNIFIGEYTTLNAGISNLPIHGSGTYRLTLDLPKGKRLYALALPEIFSSYKFYINDELCLSMGETDPNKYKAKIQTRSLAFYGEGITTLLIAVTDYSHYYSGIIHPIAFGEYQAINYYIGIKLFLKITILLISFGTGIVYLFFFLHSKKKLNLLFSLLCFCIMGYTSYYLLHLYFKTGIHPWYNIELFCSYLLLALLIAITNEICHMDNLFSRIIFYIYLGFSGIALLNSLFSSYTNITIHYFFSSLCDIIKWIAFVYVLGTCILAVKEKITNASALLLGLIFFGISLGADLILPLFNPIYGAQFCELGSLVLTLIVGLILLNDLIKGYKLHFRFMEANKQMQQQLDLQRKHYSELNAKIQETRTIRHDLRQHMRILNTLVEEKNLPELKKYFDAYNNTLSLETPLTYCENYAIDALLQYYDQACKENKIHYEVSFSLPPKLQVPDTDLCIILGNLIENAVEACIKQTQISPFISIASEIRGASLLIYIKNSFEGEIHTHKDRFLSSKRNDLGIGTFSVSSLVERYGGLISFETKTNLFMVSLLLPLNK